MNVHGPWRYIEVLWSERISLCKKLNIIYIITYNPEPQTNVKIWFFSAKVDSMNWFSSLVYIIMKWRNHNVYGIILVKHPIMMWNVDDLHV